MVGGNCIEFGVFGGWGLRYWELFSWGIGGAETPRLCGVPVPNHWGLGRGLPAAHAPKFCVLAPTTIFLYLVGGWGKGGGVKNPAKNHKIALKDRTYVIAIFPKTFSKKNLILRIEKWGFPEKKLKTKQFLELPKTRIELHKNNSKNTFLIRNALHNS